ncbi:MAG: ADP-ribosylglycohydrolase family protein [Bacilli bacterium]
MLGAIIGDIAGSTYEVKEVNALKKNTKVSYEERVKILDKRVSLFQKDSSYTDDSVLTAAIAECILKSGDYKDYLKTFGQNEVMLGMDKYGRSRFGKGFISWLNSDTIGESYGNGCAMRISPIPMYFSELDEILNETYQATITSHNHNDAINATKAVSLAIFMAKNHCCKENIKQAIEEQCGYDLNFNLKDLQQNYKFTSKAKDSVPQAIFCFLESDDFEDAIRKAISIGGDADTIAAITGSIAENYYGIPQDVIRMVQPFIPEYIKNIITRFYLKLEFLDFLKQENIYDEKFLKYLKTRTVTTPSNTDKSWFGCFSIVDNEVLVDIKLLVPEIENKDNLLVNIHEYTHAYDLYQLLGYPYIEDKMNKEARAKEMEKKYLLRK